MIVLAFPPSVNALWRSVKGRNIISESYRKWKAVAATELLIQRPPKIKGPYTMSVLLYRPDRRRRDLDNVGSKAISDSLVAAGIVEGDHLAQRIVLEWAAEVFPGGRAEITLEAI